MVEVLCVPGSTKCRRCADLARGLNEMRFLNLPSAQIDDAMAAELPSVSLAIRAGVNDEDLTVIAEKDLVGRDLLYAIAIMCAPDNEPAIARLHEALIAGELYQLVRFLEAAHVACSVEGEVTLAIADREDPHSLLKAMIEHDWLGHIASGYVLRWIVSRWRAGKDEASASLAAAAQAVEAWCQKNKIKGGGVQHITRNIWPKYKTVSHLWAAFHI